MLTQNNVKKMITNPIYAGIAGYPKIIEDEKWIEAGVIMVEEEGMENYLELVFENLKEAFGVEYPEKEKIIENEKRIEKIKLREFLTGLLNDFRKFYKKCRIATPIPVAIIHFIKIYRRILYIGIFESSISDFFNPSFYGNTELVNPPKVGYQILQFSCFRVKNVSR